VRGQVGDIFTLEEYGASAGAQDAGDGAEGGGFTGAIRADEGDDGGGWNGNAEIVYGRDGTISNSLVLGLEHVASALLELTLKLELFLHLNFNLHRRPCFHIQAALPEPA
jgi:hypothetical protein